MIGNHHGPRLGRECEGLAFGYTPALMLRDQTLGINGITLVIHPRNRIVQLLARVCSKIDIAVHCHDRLLIALVQVFHELQINFTLIQLGLSGFKIRVT